MNSIAHDMLSDEAPAILSESEQPSATACEEIVAQRKGPGMLFLTSTLQLIYMDQHSQHLCGILNQAQTRKATRGLLPPVVLDVCTKLVLLMKKAGMSAQAQDFHLRQLVAHPETPVLVWGIGVTDPNDSAQSHILVLLEESRRQPMALLRAAQRRFRLTERDTEVLRHLLKGWTNKEIANAMQVCEQTVKERIRTLMTRTRSTTRSAVLMATFSAQEYQGVTKHAV
jgi:DNA-binding CsgD family transcriptional regulator